MFFGGPFTAFDHQNYIAFINEPSLYYFEPAYTIISYLLSTYFINIAVENKFAIIYVIFTLPPLLWVLIKSAKRQDRNSSLFIYAVILTKGFIIGFISQRFFFSELALAALLISANKSTLSIAQILSTSLIHFSSLSLVLSRAILKSRINLYKVLSVCAVSYFLLKYLISQMDFIFLGYDYSRYLELMGTSESNHYLSIAQFFSLSLLILVTVTKDNRNILLFMCALLAIIKPLLLDIEATSRIFQIQTDLILLTAFNHSNRNRILFLFYAMGFGLLQLLASSKAYDVSDVHYSALQNAILVFFK